MVLNKQKGDVRIINMRNKNKGYWKIKLVSKCIYIIQNAEYQYESYKYGIHMEEGIRGELIYTDNEYYKEHIKDKYFFTPRRRIIKCERMDKNGRISINKTFG